MNKHKWVFFDCMETLVDLKELPQLRDYAMWAFDGSGVEKLWHGFEEFFTDYNNARKELAQRLPEHSEHEISERFMFVSALRMPDSDKEKLLEVSTRLYDNYWMNYKSRCYVKEDVRTVLQELRREYRLGVVSNFMVRDGIEELLEINGLIHNFDFVVTSINTGWRKPHHHIYDTALGKAGALPENTVFIGDDYINDFVTPGKLGMRAILLDRNGRHEEIEDRATDFYGIGRMLL